MKQLAKHKARKTAAYILLLLSMLLVLSTSGTEHLGWLAILTVFIWVSLFWYAYEARIINRLTTKKNRHWLRGK